MFSHSTFFSPQLFVLFSLAFAVWLFHCTFMAYNAKIPDCAYICASFSRRKHRCWIHCEYFIFCLQYMKLTPTQRRSYIRGRKIFISCIDRYKDKFHRQIYNQTVGIWACQSGNKFWKPGKGISTMEVNIVKNGWVLIDPYYLCTHVQSTENPIHGEQGGQTTPWQCMWTNKT